MIRVYLVIENLHPTTHDNLREAKNYVQFVRDTSKDHKKLKAMYCYYSKKDFKDSFCNCIFNSL